MNKPLRQVQTIYEIPGEMTEDEAADFYGSHNLGEVWEELETMQEPVKLSAKLISQALTAHFAGREEVVAVYLFGSQARGEADHLSDVDVALLLRPDLSRETLWRLELRLDVEVCDALGSDDVDVIVLNIAPLEVQFEIIRTGMLLHSNDENARTDYEVQMMSEYWDFRKILDEYDSYALRRIWENMSDAERQEYQAARDKIRRMRQAA